MKNGVVYIVIVRKGGAIIEVEMHGSRRLAAASRREWQALLGAEAAVYERSTFPVMERPWPPQERP